MQSGPKLLPNEFNLADAGDGTTWPPRSPWHLAIAFTLKQDYLHFGFSAESTKVAVSQVIHSISETSKAAPMITHMCIIPQRHLPAVAPDSGS